MNTLSFRRRSKLSVPISSAVLMAAFFTAVSVQAETMYAVTDGCQSTCLPDSRLLAIDTVSKVQTQINDSLGTGQLQALAAGPAGLLYSIAFEGSPTIPVNSLITIDPITGAVTNTGTRIITPGSQISGLAINASGDMYGVTFSNQLYRIDPVTGAMLIGNVGQNLSGAGLDFSPSGVLYSATIGNRLVTINTDTGLASAPIGSSQPDGIVYTSIAFDSAGGLWGVRKVGTGSGRLYSIDPTTSVQTLAIGTGLDGTITGIDFLTPVPVPAAVWLFGSGLAAMVGLARRRKDAAPV